MILPSADGIVQGLTPWQVQIDKLSCQAETCNPKVGKEVPEIILKVKRVLEPKDEKVSNDGGCIKKHGGLHK